MIEVIELSKDYGNILAVNNISFTVPEGQVLGFLGPNGAGKSTTMKMITGYLKPTSGRATIGGFSMEDEPIKAKKLIGYLAESAPLYSEMTVHEFLNFIAEIHGITHKQSRKTAVDNVVERCYLGGVVHQPIETLSKGYKHRVGFAQSMIHNPPVLVLDEPTDGLDPNQKHEVRNIIKGLGKDKTVLVSTHILEEVDAVCDRVIIINKGVIVKDATPLELRKESKYYGAITLEANFETLNKIKNYFSNKDLLLSVEEVDNKLTLLPKNKEQFHTEFFKTVNTESWELGSFALDSGRLDEVFRTLTT